MGSLSCFHPRGHPRRGQFKQAFQQADRTSRTKTLRSIRFGNEGDGNGPRALRCARCRHRTVGLGRRDGPAAGLGRSESRPLW